MHSQSHSGAQSRLRFQHHFISRDLPVLNGTVGDYGQTALADIDRDGRLDFIIGRKSHDALGTKSILYWFRYEAPDRWEQHILGYDSLSDVGACAMDVDGDGWPDLVCGGVWYRNPQRPREQEFTRHVFDPDCTGVHDVMTADIDGDGSLEVVTMSDSKGLFWYKIPPDPTQPWEGHYIAPGIHGAITPAGIADIDGDGDLDIVCADTWYENSRGDGTEWVAHRNIPFGKPGPFGLCVRCIVVDIDGDGQQELVMCDADVVGSKVAILKNADGLGGRWERQDLPQSFEYGSLHSLAVADFTGSGRLDILVNEQEELLPPGRENPRWVIWENLGEGKFVERIILNARLGGHELQVGDVDGDGRIDICSKAWGPQPWNGNGGKMHVDFLENLSGQA